MPQLHAQACVRFLVHVWGQHCLYRIVVRHLGWHGNGTVSSDVVSWRCSGSAVLVLNEGRWMPENGLKSEFIQQDLIEPSHGVCIF